jgi:hypothetical protein
MKLLRSLLLVLLASTPAFAQQQVQPMPQTGSPADAESNTCAQCARIGVYLSFFNGTGWDRARGDTTNGLWVNVKNSVAQTISGSVAVTGTFWQATQPVSIADGSSVTLGAKADAKSTATDTTAITIMQVLKEISFMEQNPASRAVTNTGTFATQSAITAASGSIASGAIASGAVASGAFASGSIASGAVASGAFGSDSGSFGVGSTGSAVPAKGSYASGNAATALPTAATAGNLTGVMVDKFGRQVVLPGTIRDLRACQTTTISASTSETTIVTAAGANVFADPYLIVVSNTSASTNTRVDFRDATAGTILFSLYSIGGVGPAGFSLPQSIPQTTANNNWTAQAATSTTDLRVYVCYEKNK